MGIPIVMDFTGKLVGDDTAQEIGTKALMVGHIGQLGAATLLPFQLELPVEHR